MSTVPKTHVYETFIITMVFC